MGEEAAGLGEAAAKGAGSAAEDSGGLGSLFGGLGSAAADAGSSAGPAATGAGDFAFNPGFSAADLDYLGGGAAGLGGDAAGAAGASGGGFDAATSNGSSAFDPASYSGAGSTGGGASSAPDWLNGSTMFDTGVAGAAPAADFSGGVNSFGAPGVSSFNDSIAAAAAAPQNLTAFETGSSFGNGSPSAFSPSPSITAPDISTIDPTAQGGTSGATDFSSVNRSASGGQAPVDLSGLDAAQTSAANQYAAVNANSVPTAPGDVGPNTAAAATPAAATSTPAAAADSSGKFLGMDIGKPTVLGSAGTLLSGGLLASNLLRNSVPGQSQVNAINSTIPQIQSTIDSVNQTAAQLRNSTAPLNADAQAMMSYVSQGTLPPSMQAQVSAGVQSAKSQAASIMAQHGLSADPAKNAQLKQQFDTIDSQALQLQGTLANQLYQSGLAAISASNQTQSVAANLQSTGLNALGLTQNTYLALQKIYADQDKQTQAAVTNFATALGRMSGGSGSGTTIKIGS